MKFMITDGTEISVFEIADAEAVIKAKEIILSGYLKGMLIKYTCVTRSSNGFSNTSTGVMAMVLWVKGLTLS